MENLPYAKYCARHSKGFIRNWRRTFKTAEEEDVEITFFATNTTKIHLHVEQLLQNTYWMLVVDLRLRKRQETPYIPSRVADRVFVLQPGVRSEPLRWESRVQDVGPPETARPHVISIGKSSPRDLHLNAKTQLHSKTSKLQRWTPHAKQLARQEHNSTH